ncbi:MAG: IS200/IS605 family transposase [Oligoflexia bacterium]|nr:IS200/IS605 family transposase [Oligoflexia bacterium]
MEKSSEIHHGRHCIFVLKVHLVFLPKYRRNVFTPRVLDYLQNIMISVCNDFDAKLEEFNGESDHCHLLISYPPKVSISKLVNSLKGVSSRMIRKQSFPEVATKIWGNHFWSPSYYAGSCGGVTISQIRKYIENQNRPKNPSLK